MKNVFGQFRSQMILIVVLLFLSGMNLIWASPDKTKLDPVLNRWFFDRTLAPVSALEKTFRQNDSMHVFIQYTDPAALKKSGIPIHFSSPSIGTAYLPLDQIEFLSHIPEVVKMEAGSVCKPALNESIQEIRADEVWQWSDGKTYKGKGVIIGIVDSGIDWSHPDFIAADGKTSRILFLWDQTDNTGLHPSGYTYGTLYTQAQINDELDGFPSGLVKEKDNVGHGTHVAGIAAGNGRGTGNGKPSGVYVGVAPEADLIVVKAGDDTYPDTRILDGMTFIFQKSKEKSQPAVINLSVGKQYGPHDGTSALERSIDDFFWEKGRAVVVAAGNEGDHAIHFQRKFTSNDPLNTATVSFQVNQNESGKTDHEYFNIWYTPSANVSVSLISPAGMLKGPAASMGTVKNWETGEGRIYIDNASSGNNQDNGDRSILIQFSDSNNSDNLAVGTWKLVFTGKAGQIDGWLYDSTNDTELNSGADYSTLLNEPGNARRAITVASTISRNFWPSLWSESWTPLSLIIGDVSSFSSPGPTRQNAFNSNPSGKPDISAPGEYILSSLSSQIGTQPDIHYRATDGKHTAMRGTSMSAPHVTGLVALMFQSNPTADASFIRGKLIESARKDVFTGNVWNPSFGYGKIDAVEAMKKMTAVREASRLQPERFSLEQNYPNPFNGSTVIQFSLPHRTRGDIPIQLEIVDIQGRIVRSFPVQRNSDGFNRVIWDGKEQTGIQAASGVYFYRIRMGGENLSRKLVFIR